MPSLANDAQDKVRVLQRKLYRAAEQQRGRRFHALYDKVHRRDVLERAWKEVAAHGGAAGVDGVTIEAIREQGAGAFLSVLEAELREGSYRPLAVKRVAIPKASGGERSLGIPAVRDRVVQAAAKLVIEPVFEADFLDCSWGFRPKRSARQARERVRAHIQRERRHLVVDADIKGFFDNLDRSILRRLLRERISDRRVLGLIDAWLRAGVLADGELMHPMAGTPQGGVISPLLANAYLHALDRAWQERHWRLGQLTRYADDLVIACWQPRQAQRAQQALARLLAEFGLELSPEKTRIVDLNVAGEGFDFLGYHFRRLPVRRDPDRRYCACWPSRSAMDAARQRIRELTPMERVGLPAILVVQDVNRFLKGWGAYFRHGNSTQQFKALDHYVFERVARFLSRKHNKPGRGMGVYLMMSSDTRLGLYRLAGTVRYESAAHATR
ncbi:MAG: group II intron reverse transcriptase/maturase [Actinobacteria bacterium]|nr:group II intron reverse transcriptase/maturase [Actinomycetota bacterium]